MKRWIDVIVLIIIVILFIPSIIAGISPKKTDQPPIPEKPQRQEMESIKVQPIAGKNITITLYNHYKKELVPVPLEEYVIGVVAAEMPASFELEALKAQAVAARTLAARKTRSIGGGGCTKHKGADVCSQFAHCQAWIPEEQQRKNWGDAFQQNRNKIKQAVEETRGEIITFNGQPIEVFFYSTSNGKTEKVQEVFSNALPYYDVVESPGEEDAPRYRGTVTFTYAEFTKIFNKKYTKSNLSSSNLSEKIKILNYTESGRVKEVMVGSTKMKATDFRHLYELNSTDFKFRFEGNKVHIDTIGYGHGVGMSQVGANSMAAQGKSYLDILYHYYRGVNVKQIG